MAGHKKQHLVPRCYLKAWADPSCPQGHTPYVWLFDKEGKTGRKKAPEKLFCETDAYTIPRADGSRDLRIEHGLQQLESDFAALRKSKIQNARPLTEEEHVKLCAFTAALHVRTKVMREHYREQWRKPLEMMNEMEEKMRAATPEQRRQAEAFGKLSSGGGPHFTQDQVRRMVESPHQTLIGPMVRVQTPLLARLDFAILTSDDDPGFITSDHPVVWFDPEGYKRPPMFQGPALMFPTIEITLPLAPNLCLLLNRHGLKGYVPVPPVVVDDLNRRTRFFAGEHFVVRKDVVKDIWFWQGKEPADSWEKQQAQ